MITTKTIFDHRKKPGNDEIGLEIRVTVNRKSWYVPTGIKVMPNEFRSGMVCNRPDCKELNERLRIIASKVDRYVNGCMEQGNAIDQYEMKEAVWHEVEMAADGDTLLEWIENEIPVLDIKAGTKKRYRVLLNRLTEFGKMRRWADVNTKRIYEFDTYLHTLEVSQTINDKNSKEEKQRISDAAVWNYHKCLKALLSRAERIGKIDRNPYARLKGEFKRGERENVEYLTEEEMKALESLHPVKGSQMALSRDLFVFQMYTGMGYSDAEKFDIENYKLVDGVYVNVSERVKTGVPFVSYLLPPVVDVLKNYGMKVPVIGNADYNKCLKALGMAAGIKTTLHSHLARHTFATFMLRNGVSIENLSRMLGHTNITQTQRYAKVLAQSIYEDFSMIAKRMEESNKKLHAQTE